MKDTRNVMYAFFTLLLIATFTHLLILLDSNVLV